jgi:hypothetical protein
MRYRQALVGHDLVDVLVGGGVLVDERRDAVGVPVRSPIAISVGSARMTCVQVTPCVVRRTGAEANFIGSGSHLSLPALLEFPLVPQGRDDVAEREADGHIKGEDAPGDYLGMGEIRAVAAGESACDLRQFVALVRFVGTTYAESSDPRSSFRVAVPMTCGVSISTSHRPPRPEHST